MLSVEEYMLFMFSMKGVKRKVNFSHIREKVRRDIGKYSDKKINSVIQRLIEKGLMEEKNGKYGITPEGKEKFKRMLPSIEKEIEKVNKPWLIVYKAKEYYPFLKGTLYEFCKDRYVGFYCLFTEQRFFRRDFRGRKIVLKKPDDILFFADIHYIDIIPSVHRIGSKRPDWLVIDMDPGEKIDFDTTKDVTSEIHKIMEKLGLNPALKFSGSRGFQIWSLIKDFKIPKEYIPLELSSKRKRERNYFTLFSDFVRTLQREIEKEFPRLTTSDVGRKGNRKNKILIDPSSMKPMGLVRAPYSVHSKTGFVSMPLKLGELKEFEKENASIEKTLKRYLRRGNEFLLKSSNPSKLLELLLKE